MPGNLNAVVREAGGDFVANLHDADVYHPLLLETWERALLAHPSAGLVFCGAMAETPAGDDDRIWLHDYRPMTEGRRFFEGAFVGQSSSPIWGTVMVRRDAYEQHLPFNGRFGGWADVDMWMRICGTHDICYVPQPLITLHQGSHFRSTFRWDVIHLLLSMHVLNIDRMAGSPSERRLWQSRQRSHAARLLARLFLGRAVRLEGGQCMRAVRMWRDWLAVLRAKDCYGRVQ
jgi:hypothetical protein